MKSKIKIILTMATVFSLSLVMNLQKAHAEDKVWDGKPYDIVIKYEWDNDENDIKYFFQYHINEYNLVANKIEGTGTSDGDLEKVKEFLKIKNEEFLGKGTAEDGTFIEGIIVSCPDYRVNRRNIFIRGMGGCRVVTEKGFVIDNIPEVFDSKHIYTVKASFEPRLIEKFKKVDDDYADIEPIEPKEKFEDIEIVEKTFTSKPEEKTNFVDQKNNSSNISAPNTGVQESSDVGYYAFVSLPLLMLIAWFSFKKQ